MRKCSSYSLPVAVLVVLTVRVSGIPYDDGSELCVGDDQSEINPNLTFPQIPDRYQRCDYGSCFCVAYNNASCPWNLEDFPSDVEGLLSGSGGEIASTTGNYTSIDFAPFTTLRFCNKESTYFKRSEERADDGTYSYPDHYTIAPTVMECGIFYYVQPLGSDNYYARDFYNLGECPTSWNDVPVSSASALFLPIPLMILLFGLALITLIT